MVGGDGVLDAAGVGVGDAITGAGDGVADRVGGVEAVGSRVAVGSGVGTAVVGTANGADIAVDVGGDVGEAAVGSAASVPHETASAASNEAARMSAVPRKVFSMESSLGRSS